MGNQDWANQTWAKRAVAQLESLENERVAIHEQRAVALDGDNERRLDSIRQEVDALYARLNTEAEQIAVQLESADALPILPPSNAAADSHPVSSAGPPPAPPARRPGNIDTVVVEHPVQAGGSVSNPEDWMQDERLQLRGAFEALEQSRAQQRQAFEHASRSLEGQAQELAELKAQAEAARLTLQRFEETQANVESKLAAAQEALAKQREQEKRAKLDLAAMEAKVRTEFKLLVGLDKVRERIGSVERTLQGAVASADQERALLSTSVDQALDAAERATRQAEEMRDAAERAHQRAQQAIAHAQEVETRSEVREQELLRIIDGLEGQMAGLKHERASIEEQLQELRGSDATSPVLQVPLSVIEQDQGALSRDVETPTPDGPAPGPEV